MTNRLLGIVLALAIATLALFTAACGDSLLPDGIVAKVGETNITQEQLDDQVEQEAAAYGITKEAYPDDYDEYLKSLQSYVLQNLVFNAVAAQEAAKMDITVSEDEVQAELDSYIESYSGDQAAFEEALGANGLTLELFEQNLREGLLRDKVRTEVVKDVAPASEEDILAYYEANRSSYYVDPSRELRHILVKPQADESGAITDAAWSAALSTAQEVRRKLVSTGDWTGLAAQYSDDLLTKDAGGELGTVGMGEQIKEFEEAAFALGLNDISQPVRTVYGYEIIQATAITYGGERSLEEMRSQIEERLLQEAQDEAWNEWLDEKVAEADVIYREGLGPEPTTTTDSTSTTLDATTTTI